MFRPFLKLFPSCKSEWNHLKPPFYLAPRGSTTALGHLSDSSAWGQCVYPRLSGVFLQLPGTGLGPGPGFVLPEGFLGPQQDQRDKEEKHLAIFSKGSHHTGLFCSPASLLTWQGSATTGVSGICHIKGIGSGLHWEEIMGNKCP